MRAKTKLSVHSPGAHIDRKPRNRSLHDGGAGVVELNAHLQIGQAIVRRQRASLAFSVASAGVVGGRQGKEAPNVTAVVAARDLPDQRFLFCGGLFGAQVPRCGFTPHRHGSLLRRYATAHRVGLYVEIQPTPPAHRYRAVHALEQTGIRVTRQVERRGSVHHSDGVQRELHTAAFAVRRVAGTAALGDRNRRPGRHRERILGVSEPRSVLSLPHRRLHALEVRGDHDLELQQRGDRTQAELHVGHLHDGALSLGGPNHERTDVEERSRAE